MRLLSLILIIILPWGSLAMQSISECSTTTMLPFLKNQIQSVLAQKLHEQNVEVLRNSIEFYNENFRNNGSYTTSVKIISIRGSEIALSQYYLPQKNENPLKFLASPQLTLSFSSPSIVPGIRDNEGIPTVYYCEMSVFQDYMYAAYIINLSYDNYTIAFEAMTSLTTRIPMKK